MEKLRLVTEGFDGTVNEDNSWPEVYAAYQNREICQKDAKGVFSASRDGVEIPCVQIQFGNVTGTIPAHELGMRDVPETAQEIGKLSPREKKDLTIRIEKRLVGLPVWLLITAVDKKNETFVASRKRALEIMARQAWKKIEEGAIMPATVRELGYKRAVLDLGGVEAIMYASEMSPGFTDAAADVLTIGETYRVKVIHADQEAGTIEVSRKQAMTSPWPGCASRYTKNGVYSGIVSGSIDQGVFINLEPGVDVFTFHPKFKPVYKGDKVKVTIVNVDVDRKRIFARIWGEQRGNASAGARKFGGYSAGIR